MVCSCSSGRLWGDPVNLREQHDALEFFNCLVDSLDESLKSLSRVQVVQHVLGMISPLFPLFTSTVLLVLLIVITFSTSKHVAIK